MKRAAIAVWNGTIKAGSGHLTTPSTVLNQTPYSFDSRFMSGAGTNPEELLAASHAGCYAMKLSLDLSLAGFSPEFLHVQCTISLEDGSITGSHLVLKARIPELTYEQFNEYAAGATTDCLVSKVFNLAITLEATLFE